MRKKVLLINPPTTTSGYPSVMPPLGILYVDSYLKSRGEEPEFIDLNIEKKWEKRFQDVFARIDPEIIGITSNIANLSVVKQITSQIRIFKKKAMIIAGGPLPSSFPQLYLDSGVDYVVKGEGEITFYNFVIKNKPVEGMYIKSGGKVVFTGEGEITSNLDDLPFPSLDKISIEKYFVNFSRSKPVSSLLTSRGCPFTCIFCNKSVFGSKWRARSSENVLAEIKWQVNKLGVREICVMDDNFSLDKGRVERICASISSENIRFSWQCQNGLRAENLDEDLLNKMKQSGCWKIGLAPEVGDEAILARLDKKSDLECIKIVSKCCRKLGICVHAFFMLGFPFETSRNIEKTIDFSMELNPVIADFAKVSVLPGTKLFEEYGSEGGVSEGSLYDIHLEPEKERLFRKAYMKFYCRPHKIYDIVKNIGWSNFFRLFAFGLRIGLLKA